MTNYPEFDPLHAPENPAAVDLPNPFADEEEPPSLEGMLFCSYLTQEDLTGANWEKAPPLPILPPTLWDEAPMPEEAILRAMAAARFEPGPAAPFAPVAPLSPATPPLPAAAAEAVPSAPEVSAADTAETETSSTSPGSSRQRSRSKFRGKFTPPGRVQPVPALSSLYGNLADTSWLEVERLKAADGLETPLTIGASKDSKSIEGKFAQSELTPDVPVREKLAVLEVPHEVLSATVGENTASSTQAPFDSLLAPITLPPTVEKLSVHEAIPMPQQILHDGLGLGIEGAGQAGIGIPVSAQAEASVPQREEGLVEILAFQPFASADASNYVSLLPEEEHHRPLFQSFYKPAPAPRIEIRTPHFGHLALLAVLGFAGLVCSSLLTRAALHYHLWGVSTAEKAASDIHYTIGFMAGMYFITFALAALLFPLWWNRSFFSGLQWNPAGAWRRIWWLVAAACVCFVLALVDEIVLPGPANAPIDKMFDSRTAAWLLLIFGVTFAPFFEEIVFRGFLLPALCTAFDWYGEKLTGNPPRPLDATSHPQWSLPAMILAAIFTSIPFAGMHAEQTVYSIGPFVLLVAVSLVLCWARLRTRSLAASMLVHASYNGLLFTIMLAGTGGFKHLDKM